MEKGFDGLIFDMDGVLVDVSTSYRKAIQMTASYFLKRDVSKSEVDMVKKRPDTNNDWDAAYALISNEAISYAEVKEYFQKLYLGDENNAGLIDSEKLLIEAGVLKSLRNKYGKTAIATGRPRSEALYALKKNDIEDLFDAVVALEDVNKGKPEPDCLFLVIKKTGMRRPVYIGDSPSDVIAASRAKIPSLYIGEELLGTENFSDVSEVIKYLL